MALDRGDGLQVQRPAWGLLPFSAKAKKLQGSTINARIEMVATKPAFRSAFKKHRCLIPMAGYYEWSVSGEDGKKDPRFIHADGPLWAAGLWEDTSPLLDPDNLGTFTVITGDVSADIHDRMPVWLAPSQVGGMDCGVLGDCHGNATCQRDVGHGDLSGRTGRELPKEQHRNSLGTRLNHRRRPTLLTAAHSADSLRAPCKSYQ